MTRNNQIKAVTQIMRPYISSIAAFISIAIYISNTDTFNYNKSLFIFISIFLTSGFGFMINDYYDFQKDKYGHRDRVLVQGTLKRQDIPRLSIIIVLISLVSSYLITIECFYINFLALTCLLFYSEINNKKGFIANLLVALLCSLLLIYGMLASSFNSLILFTLVPTFIFILGREIVLDIRDIESDKIIGKSSVPITKGVSKTLTIVILLLLFTISLNIFIGLTFNSFMFLICMSVLANIITLYFIGAFLFGKLDTSINNFVKISRINFILLILGIS